jgi:hypothetical protein
MKFFICLIILAFLFLSYSIHYKLFGSKTLSKATGGLIALCLLGIFLFSIGCLIYKEAMIYSLKFIDSSSL